LLKYGWPIDPAGSNRGQSNAGQSHIRDWIDLDSKHGWKLKNMGMRRNYGPNLVPFIREFCIAAHDKELAVLLMHLLVIYLAHRTPPSHKPVLSIV
jgi:hypothetical protein